MTIRLFIFTIFIAGLACAAPKQAQAGIVSAGEPPFIRVDSMPDFVYPDIYQRQLAYRETLLMLQDDMKARQKAFIAPSLEAQRMYEQDLEALHTVVSE